MGQAEEPLEDLELTVDNKEDLLLDMKQPAVNSLEEGNCELAVELTED